MAGTTTGTPEITSTFQAMDVSPKIFAALTGNLAAYPSAGVGISSLGDIDVIGQVKDDAVADFVKTIHGRRLRISGFNYTYSVDGEATEEYTAQGSEKRWFKNDVIVDRFTTPGTGPFTLTQSPIALKNGHAVLSVIVDGVYFDEVNATTVPGTREYRVTGGNNVELGTAAVNQTVVVYHANPAGNNWSYVLDPTIPAAVRGRNIPITIGVNGIKRVQSVTIRGNFPSQKIEEMGNANVVGYTTQVPEVTGDLTVLDTDTELISLFATGNPNHPIDTEFQACEFTASGLSLKIELQNPVGGCAVSGGTILKTLYIPQLTITTDGHSTSVNNNAQQTFGFKSTTGELIVYSGTKP